MIGREDVIKNARLYLNIQVWRPLRDTYVFNDANPNHTFHSAYIISEDDPIRQVRKLREYNVMPYVYGGFDTRSFFLARINNYYCPGGWDRVSGRGTKYWYDPQPRGFGYGVRVPRHLAGIDCSGYVSRCWGLKKKYSTWTLPNLCVEIKEPLRNPHRLRQGDILNRRGYHVQIFDSWAGTSQVNVYEACGDGRRRPYNIGDEFGRVVYRVIGWDKMYTPYSPFPQFTSENPPPNTTIAHRRPTISVNCTGSGDIEIYSVRLIRLNGEDIVLKQQDYPRRNKRNKNRVTVSYIPTHNLSSGRYRVNIMAINRVGGQSFWDEYSWEFTIS